MTVPGLDPVTAITVADIRPTASAVGRTRDRRERRRPGAWRCGEIAGVGGAVPRQCEKPRQRPDNPTVSPLTPTRSFYNSEIVISSFCPAASARAGDGSVLWLDRRTPRCRVASLLPTCGGKVKMRGRAICRIDAANHPASHPRPLPACGERGSLPPKRRALWDGDERRRGQENGTENGAQPVEIS